MATKKKSTKKTTSKVTKKEPRKAVVMTATSETPQTKLKLVQKPVIKVDVEIVEVNPATLTIADARKRCQAIYEMEGEIERRQNIYDKAHASATKAKKSLSEARAKLQQEISEQRFGPGPLFPVEGKDV